MEMPKGMLDSFRNGLLGISNSLEKVICTCKFVILIKIILVKPVKRKGDCLVEIDISLLFKKAIFGGLGGPHQMY